jgi:predicted transposase YbfD/YdcC
MASSVRSYWGIENSLHWMLDVTYGEDGSRAHSAQNLSTLRRLTHSMIK